MAGFCEKQLARRKPRGVSSEVRFKRKHRNKLLLHSRADQTDAPRQDVNETNVWRHFRTQPIAKHTYASRYWGEESAHVATFRLITLESDLSATLSIKPKDSRTTIGECYSVANARISLKAAVVSPARKCNTNSANRWENIKRRDKFSRLRGWGDR